MHRLNSRLALQMGSLYSTWLDLLKKHFTSSSVDGNEHVASGWSIHTTMVTELDAVE